jgi:hypothetical protein
MSREQILDEITNDKVRPTAPSVYDATVQHLRRGVPLDVDGPLSIRFHAAKLGPTRSAAWLMLLQYLQAVLLESWIACDGLAQTRPALAVDLDESLH